ncbi:MAG: hypothetical protein K2X32_09440 [Phycisphaerales bacterium]|nr:hypothetical protein [Phycisphaerales bacterium]
MSIATTVSLPASVTPEWRRVCVKCRSEDPTAFFVFTPERSGLLAWLPGSSLITRRDPVVVPACEPCAASLSRKRMVRISVEWMVVIVAVLTPALVARWAGGPMTWQFWLAAGGGLACVVAHGMWVIFHPHPVSADVMGKSTIDYQFASAAYASDFAKRNSEYL